ncbi:hypothetical protein K438DRAFT_1928125 [Mycena galopus ATCC 62051]|nr:hypothetical protein K438DRAFT_1928125 [Mycena galopus ATCC 62051]
MSYLLIATSLKYWYWTPRVNRNENAQPQRSTIAEAGTARSASINLVTQCDRLAFSDHLLRPSARNAATAAVRTMTQCLGTLCSSGMITPRPRTFVGLWNISKGESKLFLRDISLHWWTSGRFSRRISPPLLISCPNSPRKPLLESLSSVFQIHPVVNVHPLSVMHSEAKGVSRGVFSESGLPGSWNGQRYGRIPVTESYLTAAMPFTMRTNCGGRFSSLGWRRPRASKSPTVKRFVLAHQCQRWSFELSKCLHGPLLRIA